MKHANLYITCLLGIIIGLSACSKKEEFIPPHAEIKGYVEDEEGKRLQDVKVYVIGSPEKNEIITGPTGEYAFSLVAPIAGNVRADKDGYIPLSVTFELEKGDQIEMKHTLKKIKEPEPPKEYIELYNEETQVNLEAGTLYINATVSGECAVTCTENWIHIKSDQYEDNLYATINYEANTTDEGRTAEIVFSLQSGFKKTVTLTQSPGPFLGTIDYTGKDGRFSKPGEVAFVKFNRKVKITYISSAKISNLIYEEDSTLVYIPDIDYVPLRDLSYNYTAVSNDGQTLNGYINITPPRLKDAYLDFNDAFITADNKFCWLTSYDNLYLFDLTSLKKIKRIEPIYYSNGFCYNPANNCIYRYSNKIEAFDAETGELKEEISLPEGMERVISMDFAQNGYGIFLGEKQIYSIDAGNKHKIEAYTTDQVQLYGTDEDESLLRFTNVKAFNNRSQLLLHRYVSKYQFVVIDAINKSAKIVHEWKKEDEYRGITVVPHKREPYISYIKGGNYQITTLNIDTKETTKTPSSQSYISCFVPLEDTTPWRGYGVGRINRFEFVDRWNNTVKLYSSGDMNNTTASDDGKLLLIRNSYWVFVVNTSDIK